MAYLRRFVFLPVLLIALVALQYATTPLASAAGPTEGSPTVEQGVVCITIYIDCSGYALTYGGGYPYYGYGYSYPSYSYPSYSYPLYGYTYPYTVSYPSYGYSYPYYSYPYYSYSYPHYGYNSFWPSYRCYGFRMFC